MRYLQKLRVVARVDLIKSSTLALPLVKPRSLMMYSTQSSMPRLPVPPLDQTLHKYLQVIRPLVNDEEYDTTHKVVNQFREYPGPKLQRFLEDRAKNKANWLADWWREVAYLSYRAPVVVNSNPAIVFPKREINDKAGQLRFASKLISAVIEYKHMLDNNLLPDERLGGYPVCMSQYYCMMGSCRIPGEGTDTSVIHESSRHVTVMHNNQLFHLDVYGEDGRPLNQSQLYEQLVKITAMSNTPAPGVGVLTTWNRSSWAKSYKKLIQERGNLEAMEDIQRSIAVFCLDGPRGEFADEDEDLGDAMKLMLHGAGRTSYAGNRWFDKTMQFIIGEDGVSGMNFEHTSSDGPPVIHVIDYVNDYCDVDREIGEEAKNIKEPQHLPLTVSDDVLEDISQATIDLQRLADDVDFNYYVYPTYGKEFPKSHSLSPDSFIQTILQMAYYRLYNKPCATYESGSLRRFHLGRTDTIRACSVDSHNLTTAMVDTGVSRAVRAELFRKAAKAHRTYANEVVSGNGIDRHLLGWKLAAAELGMETPDLHKDPSFSKAFHFNLSTSQLVVKTDTRLMFGAVVPDGYGIFYTIKHNSINFSISSYYSCSTTDSKRMASAIRDSLDDAKEILGIAKSKM